MLEEIKEDLEKAYHDREKALKKRRDIIPLCQEGVRLLHEGKQSKASSKQKEASKIIKECEEILKNHPVLLDKALGRSYQEYVELRILKEFLNDDLNEAPTLNVPNKYYLTGLGDAIGEIKRQAMDKLGEGKIHEAESIEKKLEEIYREFNSFSYPNSIVPNLKRKQDIARKVINSLHNSITNAKI